jgi:hypothetical protein
MSGASGPWGHHANDKSPLMASTKKNELRDSENPKQVSPGWLQRWYHQLIRHRLARQAPYIATLSVFHLFIWLLNRLGVDMEIHMASALHVGYRSVRMRNDRHEPNGAEKQRPERIRVDPEHHHRCSRNAAGAVAVSESPIAGRCVSRHRNASSVQAPLCKRHIGI